MDKPGFTIVDKRTYDAAKASAAELLAEKKRAAGSEYLVRIDNEYPDGVKQTVVDKRNASGPEDVAVLGAADSLRALKQMFADPSDALVDANEDEGSLSLHDLYAKGKGLSAAHVEDITPNTLLLLPLRRPGMSAGGVISVVDESKGTLGTNCIAYVVAGVGPTVPAADQHPQTWLPVEPGDVVVVRTAMLEPLHPDLEPLSIHRRHVLAKIRVNH